MYTHGKEKLYFTVAAIGGGLIWSIVILSTMGTALIALLPVAIMGWLANKFFDAYMYGNTVRVTANQYPEIYNQAKNLAERMGIDELPEIFVINSGGVTNALAVKFLSKKYIILYSEMVDISIQENNSEALNFVISHELAHHAKGHVSFWKNLLLMPAMFVPFLGAAYSRACEYTADGVAVQFLNDKEAGLKALSYMTSGSDRLAAQTNPKALKNQEEHIPAFFGWLTEIYATHPRMTRRLGHIYTMKAKSVQEKAPIALAA